MVFYLRIFVLLILVSFQFGTRGALAASYSINELDVRGLAVSPDSRSIVLAAWPNERIDMGFLAVASVDKPDQFEIIELPPGVVALTPSFSQDSARILFAGACRETELCNKGSAGWNIFEASRDTREVRQLTDEDTRVFRWYPIEGTDEAVYFSAFHRDADIWTANATTQATFFKLLDRTASETVIPKVPVEEHLGVPAFRNVGFLGLVPLGVTEQGIYLKASALISFSRIESTLITHGKIEPPDDKPRLKLTKWPYDARLLDFALTADPALAGFEPGSSFTYSFKTVFHITSEQMTMPFDLAPAPKERFARHVNHSAFDGEHLFVYFLADRHPGRAIWRFKGDTAERFIEMPSGAYVFEYLSASKELLVGSVSSVAVPEGFAHRISIWRNGNLDQEIETLELHSKP